MDVCLILSPSMKQSQDMYGGKKKPKNGPRVVPKIHPSLICHNSLRSHAETGSAAAHSDKPSANQCEDLKKILTGFDANDKLRRQKEKNEESRGGEMRTEKLRALVPPADAPETD